MGTKFETINNILDEGIEDALAQGNKRLAETIEDLKALSLALEVIHKRQINIHEEQIESQILLREKNEMLEDKLSSYEDLLRKKNDN